MRRAWISSIAVALIVVSSGIARSQDQKPLDIYFIDVEGGQATLLVAPSGESLLIDAGNPGARDADRIAATAKDARLERIDYFVGTHYHGDHVGGVPDLAARLPILNFVDHETAEQSAVYRAYLEAREKGRYFQVKPGDKVPVAGIDVQVVSAGGALITRPLPGAGAANPLCRDFTPHEAEPAQWAEDARSVGMIIRHGRFRMLDLGDLPFNKEHDLVCPNDLLGPVDVYLTTRHGLNLAGPRALVHAVRPRVAVMNNGPKKGASREAWMIVTGSPGLEDLWQVHYSVPRAGNLPYLETSDPGGKDLNVPEPFIANLDEEPAHVPAYYIKISAREDGSFVVSNSRNGHRKEYKRRP